MTINGARWDILQSRVSYNAVTPGKVQVLDVAKIEIFSQPPTQARIQES